MNTRTHSRWSGYLFRELEGEGGQSWGRRWKSGLKSIWHVLYGLNACVPPILYIEIVTPKGDGIWGWGLWELLEL